MVLTFSLLYPRVFIRGGSEKEMASAKRGQENLAF
jgi:hypothetical protein